MLNATRTPLNFKIEFSISKFNDSQKSKFNIFKKQCHHETFNKNI